MALTTPGAMRYALVLSLAHLRSLEMQTAMAAILMARLAGVRH